MLEDDSENIAPAASPSVPDAMPTNGPSPTQQSDRETDMHRLGQRQKQVDFGKNTLGYQRYLEAVPKHKRRVHKVHGYAIDPVTPDVHQKCSKRTFDGQASQQGHPS